MRKKIAPYEAPGKAPVYASHPICAHLYFALLIQPPPNVRSQHIFFSQPSATGRAVNIISVVTLLTFFEILVLIYIFSYICF